jgi:P4 family phage/plasmid primase-like protien
MSTNIEPTNIADATDGRRRPLKNGHDSTAETVAQLAEQTGATLASKREAQKAEIRRLAELSTTDYLFERKEAGDRLGVPLKMLDDEVTKIRREIDSTTNRLKPDQSTEQLQTKLDLITDSLRQWLAENNKSLAFAGGCWLVYQAGHWRVVDQLFLERMDRVLHGLCPDVQLVFARDGAMIQRHLRSSHYFEIDSMEFDRRPYVAVRNGTVFLDTGELMMHSPDHLITRFIDIDYDPDAKCPEWVAMLTRTLEDYSDDDQAKILRFLQEWIGVALFGGSNERTPRAMRKILFLYGLPNSGKSTILDVVRVMLGTDRIVAHTPAEVAQKFGLESFLTAAAWITDEVDDSRALASNRIKSIATGDQVNVQRKGDTDANLRFHGPIAWAGNTRPNFTEASGAIYDRIVVLPLNRTFDPVESRKIFGNLRPVEWLKEQGELPGVFNWALVGYKRLLARGMFEDIATLRAERDQWRENGDPAYDFISNYTEPAPGIRNTAEVLAIAALAYVKATRSDRWPKLQTLKEGINTAIAELHPSVIKRDKATKRKIVAYDGLALTEDGLKYFLQGLRDNEALQNRELVPNQELTLPGS